MQLDAHVRERISGDVIVSGPQEACGILIGRVEKELVHVHHALPCLNEAPAAERARRFEIDSRAVLNVQGALRGEGRRIVGFYHSHPHGPARPSPTDTEYVALWPETVWLIVASNGSEKLDMRAWWLDASPDVGIAELSIANAADKVLGCS